MNIHKFAYTQIPQLANTDLAYQTEDPRLRPFYQHTVRLENFGEIIQKKHFDTDKRAVLTKVLQRQYEGINLGYVLAQNIQKLGHSHSYTITTAHQPSLLTGPLYFLYKIAGAIKLCRSLQAHYPQYHFVPLYWMGGEDHDFEEVNHFHLFNKTLIWEDKQGGSVAKYNTTSLLPILDELKNILGESPTAAELWQILTEAFKPEYNYGQAMFRFIHALFGTYGLVVLIPDAPELKAAMIPIFENDLTKHDSQTIVEKTVEQLTSAGFKNQAYVRPINLFYLLPQQRERIELQNGRYEVLNTALSFSEPEILELLHQYPERFSPNVILRPLFQETVLPNLAYIGGGGEIAYWLERKAQFAHFGVPFPMLIRRNSLQWIDTVSLKKMDKLAIDLLDIFKDNDSLIRDYIAKNASVELGFEDEIKALEAIFAKIIDKTIQTDPTLEATAAAQFAQTSNGLEKLQTRLIRSEKKKQETAINQINNLLDKLLPGGGLQERKESFIPYYLRYGKPFIDFLVDKLDPIDKDFWVVTEQV